MNNNQTAYPPYPPQAQAVPPRPVPPAPPHPMPVIRRTKNKFLTFVLATIPGAGQMYHGLMKKGVSLLLLFFGVIMLSFVAYLSVLNFLLPVIWFYSFFDTVNRMNMSVDEMRTLKDEYLFFDSALSSAKESKLSGFTKKNHVWIGVALIALSIWIILNNLFNSYYIWELILPEQAFYSLREFIRMLPAYIVPVLCLIFGVKLILGSKEKTQDVQPPAPPTESVGE